jgi:hypothetical protein
MEGIEMHAGMWWKKNLKERGNFENIREDGIIILKQALKK